MPIIGQLTPANRKSQRRATPAMVTVQDRSPQQGMRRPSAAVREGPEGVAVEFQGIIENAEPVSTR
jgi:hypothetical protein